MEKRKRLIRKGKIAILVFLTITLVILVGWSTISKKKTNVKPENASTFIPAEQLSLSFASKKAFTNSKMGLSIQYKEEIQREKAQHEKALKQLKKDQKNKIVYLTFDDGPSSDANQLLDVLNHYDAKATFFMLGPEIKQRPSVVKRMVKEGFGVGLHGITHDPKRIYQSKKAPVKEMTQDQHTLDEITGIESNLVRLPYGSIPYLTVGMRTLLDKSGFKTWDWNVDSKDWELKDRRYVQKTIRDIQDIENSGVAPVVLMHDKATTIRYLPQLLSYLQKHGYQMKEITNDMAPLTFQCDGRCH